MNKTGFNKFGEALVIEPNNIHSVQSIFADPSIELKFKKLASTLKRIAPKANEFLYFSAVMMHSAEASTVNSDGTPKLTSMGMPVKASWEKKGESWKWVCSDSNLKPYKNSNGDIFPEEELLKAYKNWVGRPLCVDHKSSSVDAIRGIILDTYYDRTLKRVIALCALDKVSYPELAQKVSLGYSTCVSMGTAVGKAICSDCGRVARTESDFCDHMRNKSCYGEINVDLQPIELSIVVNGADPQAKIRTIIAAANTANNYLAQQEEELIRLSNSTNLEADQLNRLEQLEEDLKSANEKLAELKEIIEVEAPEQTSAPYGQSSGNYEEPSDEVNSSLGLNLPERLASHHDALINEVKDLKSSLEDRLQGMEKSLEKFYKLNHKEETMSRDSSMNKKEAYFQGGGGVNEPTPGQKKYPVDPMNEKLRMEDKQMVGQGPFPDVGAVDGMHPSPESSDQKDELERKKMMARAQSERQARRNEALAQAKENLMKREGYWQGGGGVNEPEPHKVKYPVDGLQDKLREKEDKQMVGQKPFPGVGAVDGMHPSPASADQKDELERKKLLQRASLKAKFVRVANPDGTDNLGASGWQVYAKDNSGEKLVFTASVDEISGGRSEALFDVIATRDFGSKMLDKIRTVGLTKAASAYKKGQAAAPVAPAPEAPPAMPDMGAPGGVDMGAPEEAPADEGGKGDPKETALKLAEKVRDMSSDLLEAVRALTGEQAQMGEMEEGLEALPKAASSTLLPLHKMRRELNAALLSGSKKSLAELREHAEELELIASVVDDSSNKEYVETIVEDALEDAKKAIADAHGLVRAFGKYARGTAGLIKRAEEAEEAAFLALAEDDENDARKKKKVSDEEDENDAFDGLDADDESDADDENDADFEDEFGGLEGMHDEDHEHMGHGHEGDEEEMDMFNDEPSQDDLDFQRDRDDSMMMEEMHADDISDADVDVVMDDSTLDDLKHQGKKVKVMAAPKFDLTTKAGRSAYRAKLAADATGKEEDGEHMDEASLPYTDMLDEADSLADGQTQLDTKPSDNLGYIETLEEQHKRDMEVAKAEPKVRKEAERLNKLITEGKVAASELDSLISQGLDAEVVKYWKQFYGEAGKEGSEFAKLLTTETFKAKAAEELAGHKVKISRAYELANEMVRRGLLADDRVAISAQVEEIMTWNDEAFSSMKRVVAKNALLSIKKEASLVPQVGMLGTGDSFSATGDGDFQSELDRAFSGRKY